MSEQLEPQGKQPSHQDQPEQEYHVPVESTSSSYEQGSEDQYVQQPYPYNGGNNYSQRGTRNGSHGKQGQQRGGRFGSNKYNYNTNPNPNPNNASNPGQYTRYNNGNIGASNRQYNNNGYKSNRRNMNAAAMNIPWQGYYNPQMYYMAPQMAPGSPTAPMDMPASNSPVQLSASSPSPPAARKIEITTKSGEHLDLSALHSSNAIGSSASNPQTIETKAPASANSAVSNSTATTGSITSTEAAFKSDSSVQETKPLGQSKPVEENISEAEKTKREFLEQIKKRKAALERKKLEQSGALNTKTSEEPLAKKETSPKVEKKETSSKIEKKEESPKMEERDESPKVEKKEEPLKVDDEVPTAAQSVTNDRELDESVSPANFSTETDQVEPENKSEENVSEVVGSMNHDKEEANNQISSDDETVNVVETADHEVAKEEGLVEENIISEQPSEIEKPHEESVEDITEDASEEGQQKPSSDAETKAEDDEAQLQNDSATVPAGVTVSQFLETLRNATPIEDIYSFKYPTGMEAPDSKYQKSHIKYTYGPTFLLQFKDKIKTVPDEEWVKEAASKIVIPPGMNKVGRQRDGGSFGGPGGRANGGDFRKSGSIRNMEGRSNSRNSSKKKSKRMDDRRSNRGYTSRRDRERTADSDRRDDDKPIEEVAPLVPSANRWVPKSKKKETEKKLAPDGVTELLEMDEVERRMKSLLNKLTLEMFDMISSEILTIAHQSKWEKNGETLSTVIEQIFIKACDEPHWSSMYAQLCGKVVKELDPEIMDENNEGKTGPKLVLHYLVARCHAEFEKGWADKLPAGEDGTPLEPEMMSDEYYKAAAAKRRGLGLVRFIGFLYRLNLLTGKMMFECFRRLMKDLSNNPSEETLESVVELLSTVGQQFETDSFSAGQATLEGSALLDSLFANLQGIIESASISSRMKFKLIDIRELREERHWNSSKKEDGPKTIQQIHEEEKVRLQQKNNSRSNSRRVNNSMGTRNSSRREAPAVSKDNFITTRSSSLRHVQKPAPKEEPRQPQMAATNMFNALMDSNDDEE